MKEFRQAIPEGMQARVENGEVVYTPIEKCEFEIGDLVCFDGLLRIIEGISGGFVESSRSVSDGVFKNEMHGLCGFVSEYTKPTPEQEKLFNQKCLENGFWFDKANKKWIELKEGGVYRCDVVGITAVFIFDRVNCFGIFSKASIFKSGCVFIGVERCVHDELGEIKNISEAAEKEKQRLFSALKEKGKQWNADKNCVEDLKWVPEDGEKYWFFSSTGEVECKTLDVSSSLVYVDESRIEIENCFKTQEDAEKYAEYMKECSKNYKQ